MRKMLILTGFTACATACSDGQLGSNNLVRFSQVVDFKETNNFESPIATDKTMMIALQDPESESIFEVETTYAELDLTVDSDGFGDEASIFPLGFAQYGVVLSGNGKYRISANESGEELDYVDVTAEDIDRIRIANEIEVVTHSEEICTKVYSSIEQVVLHANQSIKVWVVPVNTADEPMLGLLNLTASGPENLELDAPLAGHGAAANSLLIKPNGDLSGELVVNINELSEDVELSLSIKTSNEHVTCN